MKQRKTETKRFQSNMSRAGGAVLIILPLILLLTLLIFNSNILDPQFDENIVTKENQKVVLTVLAGQSTADAGTEDMFNKALEEKFPNVQLDWECVDWGENFDSQMQGRLASGDVPDLIVGKAQDVATYAIGENLTCITPEQVPAMKKIDPSALQAVEIDGRVYGIPYEAWYQGILYNKTIFQELQLQPPATLTELEHVVAACEDQGITPFAAHFLESWKIGNMTMQFFLNNIFSQVDNWGTLFRRGNVNYSDNQLVKECLLQNQYILDHTWSDAMTIDQYESDRRFSEGEAAMYLTGSWSLQATDQYEAKGIYGIFPYPNEEGDASLIKETNMTFMVSEASEQKELCFQILQELLENKPLMQEVLDFTQSYSVITDIDTGYVSSIAQDVEQYEASGKVIEATQGNNQLVWDYQSMVADETQKWLQGKETLEQVLQYADKHRMESGH